MAAKVKDGDSHSGGDYQSGYGSHNDDSHSGGGESCSCGDRCSGTMKVIVVVTITMVVKVLEAVITVVTNKLGTVCCQ